MTDIGAFDHIIVGAGSGGCVLANRLSADPATRVLLIEAGPPDSYAWVHIPVGYLQCIGNPRTDWMYRTEPEPGLGNRAIAYPRGKVMGGCSSINGMIYMRGQSQDYDGWAAAGCTGWGWSDVLPLFMRSERYHSDVQGHGTTGEMRVERQRLHWPILDAIRDAAEDIGIPRSADFNAGSNEGSGYFEVTQKSGIRWSAARAFLPPAVRARSNLTILTGAQVTRLMFDGARVTGVRMDRDGHPLTARATGRVILCAGAVGTPQILMLSGLGPAAELARHGIDLHRDMPGVGANLQDHLQIRTVFRITGARTLNDRARRLWGKAGIAAEYALLRRGPMAMAPSQLGIFTRSSPDADRPDIEFHVQPLSLRAFGQPLDRFPAITVSVCNLRPTSRGTITLRGRGHRQPPVIAPNYLSTEADRRTAALSILAARRLMAAPGLARYAPVETLPGPDLQSDADLAVAAGRIATTIFHPVGTARMGGPQDRDAVTDPDLNVRGTDNLMIADASVMPTIISGNTHAPVVMIAERAADLIRAATRA